MSEAPGACGNGCCSGSTGGDFLCQANGGVGGREETAQDTFRRERWDRARGPGSWVDEDDGSSYDADTGVYTLSARDVSLVLAELGHWSVSWDSRSRNKLCFTSTTLSPKMPSLGEKKVWQVRASL